MSRDYPAYKDFLNRASGGVKGMGQYLEVGIAISLTVSKKKRRWDTIYTREQIEEELRENINLDLYELKEEDNEYLYWQIKRNEFVENISEFLTEQSSFYGRPVSTELMALLETKDYDQIIRAAKDKQYYEFQMIEGGGKFSYLMENVDVYGESITFFTEGKAYLECYYNLFRYMGKLLRYACKNKLKDTVVLELN